MNEYDYTGKVASDSIEKVFNLDLSVSNGNPSETSGLLDSNGCFDLTRNTENEIEGVYGFDWIGGRRILRQMQKESQCCRLSTAKRF